MPTVIPWAKARRARLGPGSLQDASTAASTPATGRPGSVGDLAVCRCGPVEEDRIGERPADVDPEKHARSLSKRRIAPGRAKGPGDPVAPSRCR